MYQVVVTNAATDTEVRRYLYDDFAAAAASADITLEVADTMPNVPPVRVSLIELDGLGPGRVLATIPAYYSPERAAAWGTEVTA